MSLKGAEVLAEKYLNSLGLGNVVHEPDGNVPPDFVVDRRIAVEVRRLNQNVLTDAGKLEGLEKTAISMRDRIRQHLREFGPSRNGESWFVGYAMRRPLEPWMKIKSLLNKTLQEFMDSPGRDRKKVRLTKQFNVDLFPASEDLGHFYVLGAWMDEDAGGWVAHELERNIRLCIVEKEAKIAPYKDKYPEWWLVLEDRIDHGVEDADRARFKSEVMDRIAHSFDRVVLLDPGGRRKAFEIERTPPDR